MRSTLEVEDHLRSASVRRNVELCDMFDDIVLLDFRESYKDDGARSMSDWLVCAFTIDGPTARAYVRTAKALDFLPAIKEAFREGHLSFDQVRWLAMYVTFAEDIEWAQRAIGMSVAEVRKNALLRTRLTRDLASKRFKRRYVRARRDVEAGGGSIWAWLPDVEFEAALSAIDRKAKCGPASVPFEQRRADGFVEICSLALGADADPDRSTVVVHATIDALVGAEANGMLAGGIAIAPETLRRLTCDARVQAVLHGPEGFAAGRMKRTVSPSMARVIKERDGTCVFPGCSNSVWVDNHHLLHWANGGLSDPENLALLCRFHHRLMHEGGWNMARTAEADLVFIRPDGKPLFAHREDGVGPKVLALARAP